MSRTINSIQALHLLRPRIALVFVAALITISAALASEYWGGLLPCALCLKQRWAYYLAVPLLAIAYFYAPQSRAATQGLLHTIGIVFLAGAGLAFYHAGIEYGFWAGPASCGGGGSQAMDTDALFAALESSKMVRCDAPAFTLFGVSLAGYNMLISLGLAGLALYPLRPQQKAA